MTETRKADQHKIYTLHNNVVKVLGKKDGKEITRTDRVPLAVFDDVKKLESYKTKSEYLKPDFEVVEDWVEYKPSADRFSLPFNPAPLVSGEPQDNGNN
jgi:hypothetical protein